MREEHTRRGDDSRVNENESVDRSTDSNARQSNGFTAVNGESHGNSSFRPDDSAKQYMQPYTNDNHASRHPTPINSTFHSHGWRPDDRSLHETSSRTPTHDVAALKRKHSILVNVDDPEGHRDLTTDDRERGSPKRRQTSTLDSAIDLTSPITTMQTAPTPIDRQHHEPAPIGPYARERSPIARGEPPPKPGPETVALLAESANKFHQTQRIQEAQQERAVSERQQSSPAATNGAEQHEANMSDDDDAQGDNHDPKKSRKRNFSNRTKTGCHTCRNRKKKCDERKPVCGNCERGNFPCAGYGPKPPPGTRIVSVRQLQVQPPKDYGTPSGPGGYYQSPSDEPGLSYSHWGRVPPTAEHPSAEHGRPYPEPSAPDSRYPPPSQDGWHRHGWPGHQATPSQFQDRFPPPDYPHGPQYHYTSSHPASLPPPHQRQTPAPPPINDPFAQYGPPELYHRPSNNRAPTVSSSSHSGSGPLTNSNSHSQHTAHLVLAIAGFQHGPSEKEKMLRGQPFLHWLDNILISERDSCSIAIDCYNKGSRSDKGLSREAKAGLFAQLLDPGKRTYGGHRGSQQQSHTASPVGTVKDHTIVESPFKCDYGYNIHLGSMTVLQAGCYLQDAADITIGDRVIIGPDVKVHTLTASVDCGARKGSQGHVVAGAVLIEDDVFIGANCTILPYCTIGRGAVVGAGSVVTRDVKESTVVAGNPAKFIRSITPGSIPSAGVGEGQVDRRHAYEIQERNDRVKKRMVDYANSGFNRYSPRLI